MVWSTARALEDASALLARAALVFAHVSLEETGEAGSGLKAAARAFVKAETEHEQARKPVG